MLRRNVEDLRNKNFEHFTNQMAQERASFQDRPNNPLNNSIDNRDLLANLAMAQKQAQFELTTYKAIIGPTGKASETQHLVHLNYDGVKGDHFVHAWAVRMMNLGTAFAILWFLTLLVFFAIFLEKWFH